MIRTRDFLLYMLVLVFLLIATSYTGLAKQDAREWTAPADSIPVPSEEDVYTAEVFSGDAQSASALERMREKIAAGKGEIIGAPPVMTSVDTLPSQSDAATTTLMQTTGTQYCSVAYTHHKVANWPPGTNVVTNDGVRQVLYQTQTEETVGSSTQMVTHNEVWSEVPIRTVRTAFDSCLPDMTIGITTTGQPLSNSAGMLYQTYAAADIVGYARDGFPIYGPVLDESGLDSCGGLYAGGQYQYHVRAGTADILSCFAGVPADL